MAELADLWAKVTARVVAAGVLGFVRWIWVGRRKLLDWIAAVGAALSRRRARRERASRAELVQFVLQRAEVLKLPAGEDLPVKVVGRDPALITFHPTGRTFALYPDFSRYRSGVQRHEVNPARAHYGKPPTVLSRWSEEHLREWLRDRADELPPNAGA